MDKQTKRQFQNLVAVMEKGFERVDKRFDKTDKKIDKKIEELAVITKKGFDHVDKRFADFQEENKKEHAEIRLDLEEISGKLTGVVYRPELIELEQRLQRIEIKLGLPNKRLLLQLGLYSQAYQNDRTSSSGFT